MLQLISLLLGTLTLVVGLIAKFTNNVKLMKNIVKQKTDETDEAYMKRSLKFVLIFTVAFFVMGISFSL